MTIRPLTEKIRNSKFLNRPVTAKDLLFIAAFIQIFLRILSYAWCSDDAYHAYIMSANLLAGKGFTPTPWIRVNVSTCPLWTLVVTLGMSVWNNAYAVGMILNLLFSGIALFILFKFIYKKDNWLVSLFTVTAVLCTSKTYLSYTTSGLENAQIIMLSSFYLVLLFKNEYFSRKELFKIALVEGLIAFTRMDCALIFSFTSVYVFLFKYKKDEKDTGGFSLKKLPEVIPIAVLGLLPFILWELFSWFYYGNFAPNTALAKLNTGFPLGDYLVRGVWYGFTSMFFDVAIVALPVLFVVYSLAINRNNLKLLFATLGTMLYLMYIIYIGGDFMLGRHFLSLFWVTLLLSFMPVNERLTMPFFVTLMMLVIVYDLFQIDSVKESYDSYVEKNRPCWFADEQKYYHSLTGLVPIAADYLKNGEVTIVKKVKNYGVQWFYTGDKTMYEHRLYDPLLVRLPAVRLKNWRVGHMRRKFPDGYKKTLDTGINYIKDKDLALYYDKLKFILSGSLFDLERLKETVKFNNGVYDSYLQSYIKKHDLSKPDKIQKK